MYDLSIMGESLILHPTPVCDSHLTIAYGIDYFESCSPHRAIQFVYEGHGKASRSHAVLEKHYRSWSCLAFLPTVFSYP
jgi:hypothetical protein